MNNPISRRTLLKAAGANATALLIARRIAAEETGASAPDAGPGKRQTQTQITTGDAGMQLTVIALNERILRITVAAVGETTDRYFDDGSLAVRAYPEPLHTQRADMAAQPIDVAWGVYTMHVEMEPLRLSIRHPQRGVAQELTFNADSRQVQFQYGNAPVYGLGPGAHAPIAAGRKTRCGTAPAKTCASWAHAIRYRG